MSFATIAKAANDRALADRVTAAVAQEAWANPTAYATPYGLAVRFVIGHAARMFWPVAVASDIEAAYAYALNAGNPDPGGDDTVITDGQILAVVQANWPTDPAP